MTAGGHNFKNRRGERHGRLVVQKRAPDTPYGHTQWECKCDCGNTAVVATTSLVRKSTKSCGCIQRERQKDLTDTDVGRWHVDRKAGPNAKGEMEYWCTCACGYIARVNGWRMRRGRSNSCGCLKVDRLREYWAAKKSRQVALREPPLPKADGCGGSAQRSSHVPG